MSREPEHCTKCAKCIIRGIDDRCLALINGRWKVVCKDCSDILLSGKKYNEPQREFNKIPESVLQCPTVKVNWDLEDGV